MLPETLVGLACLIASGGTVDQNTASKLTAEEALVIEALAQKSDCIPANAEKLLQETKERMKSGEIEAMKTAPTTESF